MFIKAVAMSHENGQPGHRPGLGISSTPSMSAFRPIQNEKSYEKFHTSERMPLTPKKRVRRRSFSDSEVLKHRRLRYSILYIQYLYVH